MHGFDGPAVLDERTRQVVQQLRMCRPFAGLPEVARSAHDSLAEVPLPDSVGHYTRRQRICRVGQPVSQFLASTSAGDGWLPLASKNHGKALRNQVSLIFGVAADEYPLLRNTAFSKCAGEWGFGRAGFFKLLQSALECSQAFAAAFANDTFAILLG